MWSPSSLKQEDRISDLTGYILTCYWISFGPGCVGGRPGRVSAGRVCQPGSVSVSASPPPCPRRRPGRCQATVTSCPPH